MPRNMRSRASAENFTSLAAIVLDLQMDCFQDSGAMSGGLFCNLDILDDAHDVGLIDDEQVGSFDLDFSARPFAKNDPVALLHIQRMKYPILAPLAAPHGDHFA